MVNLNKLKGEIVAAGLTQAQLAKKADLKLNVLSAKLNGHSEFKVGEAKKICDVLKIYDCEKIKSIFFA